VSALQEFLNSQAGAALLGMLGVAFADFLTGTFAALRDGTFALDSLAAFLRKHIWGRVAPIGTLLVLGYFGGAGAGQLFLAAAIAAAVAYAAETASSILGNLSPPKESDIQAPTVATELNPVPED
jgi:hypothetical protein